MVSKPFYEAIVFENTVFEDTLSIIGMPSSESAMADRFGILNEGSPWNIIHDPAVPIPKKVDKTPSLRDICVARAAELIERGRKEGKKLAFLCSGGVDSTAMVCSAIAAGIKPNEVIIVYTRNSVTEYPEFFRLIHRWGYQGCLNSSDTFEGSFKKIQPALMIHGWCADQLFGSLVDLKFPEYVHYPVYEGYTQILRYMIPKLTRREIKFHIEKYLDYAKQAVGVDIKYTCQLSWFYNFASKWSSVSNYPKTFVGDEEIRGNTVVFFDSIPFQEWALNNYETLNDRDFDDPSQYKAALKEIIREVLKDDEYCNTKGKVTSWRMSGLSLPLAKLKVYSPEGYLAYDICTGKYSENTIRDRLTAINHISIDYLKDSVDKEKYLKNALHILNTRLELWGGGLSPLKRRDV